MNKQISSNLFKNEIKLFTKKSYVNSFKYVQIDDC